MSNWRSYLLGFWRRHQGQRGSAQRPGGQNRSTVQPARSLQEVIAWNDAHEPCAYRTEDQKKPWNLKSEKPDGFWDQFQNCELSALPPRELARRTLRGIESRWDSLGEFDRRGPTWIKAMENLRYEIWSHCNGRENWEYFMNVWSEFLQGTEDPNPIDYEKTPKS